VPKTLCFAGDFLVERNLFREPAAGQEMSPSQNDAMFALVGTIYGGNGRTTFKFPDLRKSGESLRAAAGIGRKKPGLAYVIARFGIFPSRNRHSTVFNLGLCSCSTAKKMYRCVSLLA